MSRACRSVRNDANVDFLSTMRCFSSVVRCLHSEVHFHLDGWWVSGSLCPISRARTHFPCSSTGIGVFRGSRTQTSRSTTLTALMMLFENNLQSHQLRFGECSPCAHLPESGHHSLLFSNALLTTLRTAMLQTALVIFFNFLFSPKDFIAEA